MPRKTLNLAKDRLQTLLDIMLEHNWTVYHFPGHDQAQTYPRLLLYLLKGVELRDKLSPLPEEQLQPGKCWENALLMQHADPTLQHWQGFIANKDSAWPTPHAWNVKQGKVLDMTVDASQYDYFGLNVDAYPQLKLYIWPVAA